MFAAASCACSNNSANDSGSCSSEQCANCDKKDSCGEAAGCQADATKCSDEKCASCDKKAECTKKTDCAKKGCCKGCDSTSVNDPFYKK